MAGPAGRKRKVRKPGEGLMVGPYRLVEKIGEGGMGDVFLAEQLEPIKRNVALKIIKMGMDTQDFVTRFESERQALAMMDYPYIAQVIDAGATDRGRPYLVMEYVQGKPLLEYCDAHQLGIEDRIELFVKVCQGIRHAHQKAIIHRDLKSNNVLVVEEDGKAWPKIIDFGVAKVLGPKITDQTIQTQMGEILGTPEFMSPEQADLTGGSIDTRTDVYLLGGMLYELLSGLPPFDPDELRKSGLDGMLFKIRSIDPPRPSVRLRECGEQATALAAARGVSVEKLVSLLAGDLDWIVMMSLEKVQDLRYQTAHAIIADLQNYRNSLPITARPPSTSYRVKKFVNRHRTGVAAASFVSLAVILGIIGTSVGLVRSQRAERRANIEAVAAKEVSDFMVGIFEVSDPGEALGSKVTAREILAAGVQRIEFELSGQPLTQARLMNTMGRVYMELGLFNEAENLLAQSLETMEGLDAEDDPQSAAILNDYGHLQREVGDFDAARGYLETALTIREENFGPDHELVSESLNSLANLLYAKGEYEAALVAYQRALVIREENLGPNDPEVAIIQKNIGSTYLVTRDYEQAERALMRSLTIRESSLPANHPDITNSLTALAVLYNTQGNYEKALDFFGRSLAIRETVYGQTHPQVAENLGGMAEVLGYMGDFEQSEQLFKRSISIYREAYGPDHPKVGSNLVSYGYLLFDAGRSAEADTALTTGVAIIAASSGPNSVDLVRGVETLGLLKLRSQDFEGALTHFARVQKVTETNFGPDYGPLATTYSNIGLAWTNLGDLAQARTALEKGTAIAEQSAGKSSALAAECLLNLGYIDTMEGDFETATVRLHEANRILTATYGPESREAAFSTARIALLEYYQGHYEQARTYFDEAVGVQARLLPVDHEDLLLNHYNLACLNAVLGDKDLALQHLGQAVDNGFANPFILEDPDLNSLRGDAEFDRLVAKTTAGQ